MDDKLDEEDILILASILKYMDHLTLWCFSEFNSISQRYDNYLTKLVFSIPTVSYGTLFFSTLHPGHIEVVNTQPVTR